MDSNYKILHIICILSVIGLGISIHYENNKNYLGPYPGNDDHHEECKIKWKAGYFINVFHCNKHLSNHKFIPGEKVKLKGEYDKNCYGIISGHITYATRFYFTEQEKVSGQIGIASYYTYIKCGELISKNGSWINEDRLVKIKNE